MEKLSGKLGSFRLYLRDQKPCSKIEGEADFKPDRPKKDSLKMIAPNLQFDVKRDKPPKNTHLHTLIINDCLLAPLPLQLLPCLRACRHIRPAGPGGAGGAAGGAPSRLHCFVLCLVSLNVDSSATSQMHCSLSAPFPIHEIRLDG